MNPEHTAMTAIVTSHPWLIIPAALAIAAGACFTLAGVLTWWDGRNKP